MDYNNIPQEFFDFVSANAGADVSSLRLKYLSTKVHYPFDMAEAINQIECRMRTALKLPKVLSNNRFLFPHVLSSEQASAEAVATYNSSLIEVGASVTDLTSGLGIDALAISHRASVVKAIERDEHTADCLRYNAQLLGCDNITVICANAEDYLQNADKCDVIYLDPARRNTGKRTYALEDCSPDVVKLMPGMLQIAERVIIKASPMLDITMVKRLLPEAVAIHIVSLKGECKEVLIDCRRDSCEGCEIVAVDLDSEGSVSSRISYDLSEPTDAIEFVSLQPRPGDLLLEPNASVMKTGAWGILAQKYPAIKKFDVNTHLFTCGADENIAGFPGRILVIKDVFAGKGCGMKTIEGEKVNIVSRNHPLKPSEIKKKYRLQDGGDRFLYAVRVLNHPVFILATRP